MSEQMVRRIRFEVPLKDGAAQEKVNEVEIAFNCGAVGRQPTDANIHVPGKRMAFMTFENEISLSDVQQIAATTGHECNEFYTGGTDEKVYQLSLKPEGFFKRVFG